MERSSAEQGVCYSASPDFVESSTVEQGVCFSAPLGKL